VIEGPLPEETVLLRVDNGRTVRLNATAAWLWDQLESPLSVEQLGERLGEEFGLEADRAKADAASFAGALAERGFVSVAAQAG
jgi:Coenzyme PQQ synthesis protein D (PqqD)